MTEITAAGEARLRQTLIAVALGRKPADLLLRVGRLLDTNTGLWREDVELAIHAGRIACVGPRGSFAGTALRTVERPQLSAVPGLGEVHKHIESSHVTPEYEAALVIPRGNTWTCEASHEFSNVVPQKTLEFWLAPARAGSPLKIFPLPGSAVPPTAWEHGAHLDGQDQSRFLTQSLMAAGLDEVMDWPAVSDPANPAHDRLWSMMEATWAARAVVEGHAAGIRDLPNINAFAASGIASDHEAWTAEEAFDKLQAGLFVEIRIHTGPEIIAGLLERGLTDWSQVALATDDRPAQEVLATGATDRNVRMAIDAGLAPEKAIQLATINPARHMRLTPWVGSLTPGRFADIVLLSDVERFEIAEVWADGRQASDGTNYLLEVPRIDWPDWARQTVNIGRALSAQDFAIPAPRKSATAQAAVLRPFHWTDDFLTFDLPVAEGLVQRDESRNITKFAIVDRYSGTASVSKMFWLGCGPKDPGTALCCSMAHDKHNVWAVGSCDAAMALAVNTCAQMQGGWVLVHRGEVVARVPYEIAGLMTARPAEALAADMAALYAAGEQVEWMFEPSFHPRWAPGFPERLAFATLTCSPWRWNLVAPSDHAPEGLVQVQTGETHPVVW
ncbi:amidohydrolase family protein [Pseudooceanicola sp. CBS1P-1]|uniref:adenine deaminase n=1 Tax=Pseudooceanicola albus TaxID=2692189 RepID=A0A6L7G3E4_9RHOB|nr:MULTISPECIES: adenine deaminase C-terminal domain-containing protein [Pseudooceanicola]MBT9384999.1 amidohydrolase family protein [Pseudooceanicola endophyticus]MXN18007.1 amidohydrolase family protein [Pseudooceanicola albus]